VLHSDTAIAPLGLDTYGSRSLPVGGVAIAMACDKVIDKAKKIAAHQLEANEDDLEFAGGTFTVKGSPDKAMPLAAIAFEAFTAHDLPDGLEPNLEAQVTYDPPNFSWPFGTHICTVEVDVETGHVQVLQYVAVDDCGNQVNPLIVEGQVHGGVIQGLAQALFEEAVYDDRRQPQERLARRVPRARRQRRTPLTLGHTITPSPTNQLGVKGIGEAGTIGAAPAVINAIVDALSGLGVTDVVMPASPHTVWKTIQAAPRSQQVIPAAFDYVRAGSAAEAISLIGQHGDEAKFLAGGHSLLPLMKLRLASPSVLVDIGRVSDLSYIRDAGDHIAIGALTRHMDVETSSPLLQSTCRCWPTRPATSATRRCATAARWAAPSPTPTRPATCPPPRSRSAPPTWCRAPTAPARSPPPTSTRASSVRARARRDAHRDPRAEDERRRLELPEVQPPCAGLGDRRRGRLARQRRLRCRAGQHGQHAGARHQRLRGLAGGASIADAAQLAAAEAEPQGDLNASVEYRSTSPRCWCVGRSNTPQADQRANSDGPPQWWPWHEPGVNPG
jgi:hypothetical protein